MAGGRDRLAMARAATTRPAHRSSRSSRRGSRAKTAAQVESSRLGFRLRRRAVADPAVRCGRGHRRAADRPRCRSRKPWFLGLANIRGNLLQRRRLSPPFSAARPGRARRAARLVLFGAACGDMNAGIVVAARARTAQPRRAAAAAPPTRSAADWYAQRWMDADGNAWQEIDLGAARARSRVSAGRRLSAARGEAAGATDECGGTMALETAEAVRRTMRRRRRTRGPRLRRRRRRSGWIAARDGSLRSARRRRRSMDQLRTAAQRRAGASKLPMIGNLPIVRQFQVLGVLLVALRRARRADAVPRQPRDVAAGAATPRRRPRCRCCRSGSRAASALAAQGQARRSPR